MLWDRVQSGMAGRLKEWRGELQQLELRLAYLDPRHPLERGYVYMTNMDGQMVTKVREVQCGDQLRVILQDGRITTQVQEIQEENDGAEDDI